VPEDNESLNAKKSTISDLLLKLAGVVAALTVLAGAATTFVGSLQPLRDEIIELVSSSKESRNPLVKDNEDVDIVEVVSIVQELETVLDISRVAEGYQIKVDKYASVDPSNYKLQVNLDRLTDNSASFRIMGENSYTVSSTLSVGGEFDFIYNNEELKLKVVSIQKPSWYRKKSMYFKIERYK